MTRVSTTTAVAALLGAWLASSAAPARAQITPVEIDSLEQSMKLRVQSETPDSVTGGESLTFNWGASDLAVDGGTYSGSGTATSELVDSRVRVQHSYSSNLAGASSEVYQQVSATHDVAFRVPDVGVPSTSLLVFVSVKNLQATAGTRAGAFTEAYRYQSSLLSQVNLGSRNTAFGLDDSGSESRDQTYFFAALPGDTVVLELESTFQSELSNGSSTGSTEFEIAIYAAPEPAAALLQLGALAALAALR